MEQQRGEPLASHIHEVLRVGEREASPRDPVIVESWRRCLLEHQLDPRTRQEANILPQSELREHQERLESFLHTARYGAETLYRQVAGLGYVLLLTDEQGITVDFLGDPTLGNQLEGSGLLLGADWSEAHAGTCAVGTCLRTEAPLTVHLTDHFFLPYTVLTCTAAPVFNPYGELLAVLTIAAPNAPQPKSSQHLALKLVQHHAHRIEKANLYKEFGREWIIKLGSSEEFADVDPEFLLALDPSGSIIGFNHSMQTLLAQEAPGAVENPNELLGRHFEDFFDCPVNKLPEFVLSRPTGQRVLHTQAQARTLFAQAIPPQMRAPAPPQSSPVVVATPPALADLTGGDPVLQRHLAKAERLVNANVSILLLGETGTGKERFAKALHESSSRANAPFVAVNCAAIPESLIESELFGYVPGTFTGAQTKGKRGLILEANGGTLFLDEIGDMPLSLQARLLRVLAEREVLPLGAVNPLPVNLRVISATHQDLVQQIEAGRFRDDLYYRLNGAIFTLPPLRERQDFEWLVRRLLEPQAATPPQVSPEAMRLLRQHTWPGNIRELRNVLEFAAAVCHNQWVLPQDLPEQFHPSGLVPPLLLNLSSEALPRTPEQERSQALEAALIRNQWNISKTTREVGLSRATIYRHMERYGIVPPNRRG